MSRCALRLQKVCTKVILRLPEIVAVEIVAVEIVAATAEIAAAGDVRARSAPRRTMMRKFYSCTPSPHHEACTFYLPI